MAQPIATDRKAYIITAQPPHRALSAFELAKQGTVVLVGRAEENSPRCRKSSAEGPARGIGRVRLVRSCERAACGLGDHRATSPRSPVCSTMRASGRCAQRGTRWAGHDIRDEPSRPVRADRWRSCRISPTERTSSSSAPRRRSRAQTRYGRWLPWRSLYLCGGERTRRVDVRRLCDAGEGLLRHVKTVQSRHGDGVRRETPRLRFNALEPGFTPNTGLGREANAFPRFLLQHILPLLAPFKKYWSTPKRAARVAAKVLINASGQTGVYYDDGGYPMLGSALVPTRSFRIASLARHAPCLDRGHNSKRG